MVCSLKSEAVDCVYEFLPWSSTLYHAFVIMLVMLNAEDYFADFGVFMLLRPSL